MSSPKRCRVRAEPGTGYRHEVERGELSKGAPLSEAKLNDHSDKTTVTNSSTDLPRVQQHRDYQPASTR
jgi:hypothetical protein